MSNITNNVNNSQLNHELKRERPKQAYAQRFQNTLYMLLIIIAISVLLSPFVLPIARVSSEGMAPTLKNGELIVFDKTNDLNVGDLCCFKWNNKTLIKRIVAVPGDVVRINNDGTVYINDQLLNEPYITDKDLGMCDITFPYQVPESSYFVLGDCRQASIDSRSTVIGNVHKDQIVGKVWFRIYPFNQMGFIK